MTSKTQAFLFTAAIALIFPAVAQAKVIDIAGSTFVFRQAPVDPTNPDGFCNDPVFGPGLLFNVVSDDFSGELRTPKGSLPFIGMGEGAACVFEPQFGITATFSGTFVWYTNDGEITGSFFGVDFVTPDPTVYEAAILLNFDGGTGKFAGATGSAVAWGLDLPFGGLLGDPAAAGVDGTIVWGWIRV